MKFSITYRRTQSITATYPANDLLALHAINSFGFVLNDPATWDRSLTGPQFAEVIATAFDEGQPQVAAVLAHLRSLGAPKRTGPVPTAETVRNRPSARAASRSLRNP